MTAKGAETRQRMIAAAQDSLERNGYFGTGLNPVLAASGTPKGSLYFHFPGGKDELVVAAIEDARGLIDTMVDAIGDKAPAEVVAALIGLLGERLETSGWQCGCPVATVALEVAGTNDAVQQACSNTYTVWTSALRTRLEAAGRADAERLAVSALALIEGALLLARAHRSREPLVQAARTIADLLG
ncbi:TetR/AcrR family transcriptional regulator [Nocardia nova]|nr:TetR/AcrR family transcriptional regulator [Nocardia nova]